METATIFQNKRVVLGVTGSIAVYKAVDLASKLTQIGAQVDVIMTEAAMRFVTPLTFQSVTGRPVYSDLWESPSSDALPTHIAHIGLGESADIFIIAPATANTLAKITHGVADDLLSITALATRAPIVIAPAMDGGMYEHPATQSNIQTLLKRGVNLIEPEVGRFASGLVGKGRLPETSVLMGHIRRLLGLNGPLKGVKVVVSAGGTREAIDPVRYITNRSSGKQGYAIAQAALDAGADVTLVTTASLPDPIGANIVRVDSAEAMLKAILEHSERADVVVMSAAVADFRPATIASQKIKKQDNEEAPNLALVRNPDILMAIKERRTHSGYPRLVVGFAAESHDLLSNARQKLERKGLDILVANDITADDAGFNVDTNRVTFLFADGHIQPYELMSKNAVGEVLITQIAQRLFL